LIVMMTGAGFEVYTAEDGGLERCFAA
jgi:hypothetical protein